MQREHIQKFAVPPKTQLRYEKLEAIAETDSYRVFEATCFNSHEKHIVRILDTTKAVVNQNYEHAASLFIQELLYLQSRVPGSVQADTFEISQDCKQIACGILPYIPLSSQAVDSKEIIDLQNSNIIEKLLNDVLSDIEFLRKTFKQRISKT